MQLTRRAFMRLCGAFAASSACATGLAGCQSQSDPAPKESPSLTQKIVGDMSLEEKVAQLFVVTPEQAFNSEDVTLPSGSMTTALAERPVSGITFFGENLQNTAQATELLSGIKAFASEAGILPLFLCVDEEGGLVQRIGGNPGFGVPSIDHACDIGATGDVAVARQAATDIAKNLLDIGLNVDFAPSCDVSSGPASMVHKRSFSTDAALAASMAAEEIMAFEDAGILCCAKHFPGIGDPENDSHEETIVTNKVRDELEMQLIPFRAAIEVNVPFVMVSHLSLPAITGSGIPASLSPEIVQKMLREELQFKGVIITDSLSMGAVGAYAAPADVAVMAIEAGCDIALMPPDFEAAYQGLLSAVSEGRISESRIDESLVRIIEAKLCMPGFDV